MKKSGGGILDYIVHNPKEILPQTDKYDLVIVAAQPGRDDILRLCKEYGVDADDSYVMLPIEVRRQFLQDWASLYDELDGAVAEVGVFQGDFAKHINKFFPNKKLYLFDTFEGFDERDVAIEKEKGFSVATSAELNMTSVEFVMQKMTYPQNIIIKKGFFPQTAQDVEEKFCFVNLDVDLYQPTLVGLKWLSNKMVKNGVILIHDYFSANYRGVKQAVHEFMAKHATLKLLPVGDGISILISGF